MPTSIINGRHQGPIVAHHDISGVYAVEFTTKTVTVAYNGDLPRFENGDMPAGNGTLTPAELDEIAVCGGTVRLYADDLYTIDVIPAWFDLELELAVADALRPPWPAAEDMPKRTAAETFAAMVTALISDLIVD